MKLSLIYTYKWIEILKQLFKRKVSLQKREGIVIELKPTAFILLQEITYQTRSEIVGIVNVTVSKGFRLERVLDMQDYYSNGFTLLTLDVCRNAERAGVFKAVY